MAASVQLGISSKQILPLSLLLLVLLLPSSSSSPLRFVTAADTSSPETCELAHITSLHPRNFVLDMLYFTSFFYFALTVNNDGSMEKKFSICKFTGHFRVQFFGVVVECPEVDAPKLEPISKSAVPACGECANTNPFGLK
jgi:hypothetical protein